MSFLPPDFVIASSLEVGVVYKISAPELISTNEPHYFIVVAINSENNYMVLSTTQLQNKIDHLNRRGFDLNTLAYLAPNTNNGLTDNSYFNCNDYFSITKEELITKVREQKLSISGKISETEYDTIVASIRLSTINDIPKFLLKYRY